MKEYAKKLAEGLGFLIYGIAQVYDVDLDEVCEEAFEILNAVPHPKSLFEVEQI